MVPNIIRGTITHVHTNKIKNNTNKYILKYLLIFLKAVAILVGL